MTFTLDLKEFTLDGKPVDWSDVVIFCAVFAAKHPDDRKAQELAEWLHGYEYRSVS